MDFTIRAGDAAFRASATHKSIHLRRLCPNDAQFGGCSGHAVCSVSRVPKSAWLGRDSCSEFRTGCLRRQSRDQYNLSETRDISCCNMPFGPSSRSDYAPQPSIMEEAGQKLKRIRERLRLKYRDVEEASLRIAAAHQNDEFVVALSRLADIENKGTMPSMYRTLLLVRHLSVGSGRSAFLVWCFGCQLAGRRQLGRVAADPDRRILPRDDNSRCRRRWLWTRASTSARPSS